MSCSNCKNAKICSDAYTAIAQFCNATAIVQKDIKDKIYKNLSITEPKFEHTALQSTKRYEMLQQLSLMEHHFVVTGEQYSADILGEVQEILKYYWGI